MTNSDPTPAEPVPLPAVQPPDSGLKLIAVLKIIKAVLITGLAVGFFRAIDKDLGDTVHNLTVKLRIDPENHLIRLLLEKLKLIDPKKLHTFGIISLFYALELYVEGLGLWFNQAWAKYLVVIATGFWIPEESLSCLRHFTWGRFFVLLLNVAVLVYVIRELFRHRRRTLAVSAPPRP